MRKYMALVLGMMFVGSVLVAGCTPKQEPAAQAPAMEEGAAMGVTPAAEATVAPVAPAAPAAPATK